jgi:hypothetical protein
MQTSGYSAVTAATGWKVDMDVGGLKELRLTIPVQERSAIRCALYARLRGICSLLPNPHRALVPARA